MAACGQKPMAVDIPKGTDLSRWNSKEIDTVATMLNSRLRKTLGWKTPPKLSTNTYSCWNKPVLPRSIELKQYTSIAYTDRLEEIGAAPSIGTIGDSFDNALAETTNGLYKTELHRNPAALVANGGPWKELEDLEIAT
jgi:transposase InsO family protein